MFKVINEDELLEYKELIIPCNAKVSFGFKSGHKVIV